MDIKEAQKMIYEIYYDRDKKRGINRTLLRTFQELAELSDTIMQNRPLDEIEKELGDLFAWVISIANLLHVDLVHALVSKYNHVCSKCGKAPCECIDEP